MGNLGFPELVVILLVALLVLGPKRLPEVARAMGQAVRAFQDAMKNEVSEKDETPQAKSPPSDTPPPKR